MAMYGNLLANVPTDLWIGGKWRESSDGGRFDVIDPATENKVASWQAARLMTPKLQLTLRARRFRPLAATW
jgi:acyl-CoA reductase-like NAD-dependent aldehyde dehydrogenase